MQGYIAGRILQAILTLVVLTLIVFILSRAAGDPIFLMVGTEATEEQYQAARKELGLDKPLITQYATFAKNALKGDFGESIASKQSVRDVIMHRFPATAKLGLVSAIFAIPIALILGVLCAIKRNKAFDMLGRTIAVLGQSLPSFWVGLMLILLFSVTWGILPVAGMDGPSHYVLPAISLGLFLLAGITRLTRSSMLDVLGRDYVNFRRAVGTPEASVILKHALRNAAIPVITLSAVLMAFMLTGSVVVETVFAWPGVGRLAYQSILVKDFPVIQGVVLIYGAVYISMNLLADVLYAWVDPRIRY